MAEAVYVPDSEEAWLPATVVSSDDNGEVGWEVHYMGAKHEAKEHASAEGKNVRAWSLASSVLFNYFGSTPLRP